jgi:uncharacterized integral membrane protein
MSGDQKSKSETSTRTKDAESRRLRLLWVGLITYFLIMLNALRYVSTTPYQFVIVGALVNASILAAFIFEMRKIYRRLRE